MNARLSVTDWAVVVAYLLLTLCVGLYAARKQKTTRDFFLGGRSLPWWAATLSIIAAETSAVTYIGTPRMGYEGDWWFLQLVLGLALGRIFLALFLVPLFYRHEILTIYGFLEKRYGDTTRVVAAAFFLLGRVVASGVRLYAGCLAVQVATGLPLGTSVVLLGAFAMLYTLAGGIRSVIWTDVLLGLTFIAGGIVSAIYIVGEIPGGLGGLLADPELSSKIMVFHGGWHWTQSNSFLAGIIGGFVLTLATHGTDQDIVQRVLTCGSSRSGKLSIIGTAVLIVPLMALFLAVGALLFFFYKTRQVAYPLPENLDHLFPVFIVRELPTGFSGLVMAGLFAASISSFASVINALAATTLNDFYSPLLRLLRRDRSDAHLFRFSRSAAFFWGLVLLAVALAFQGSSDNILSIALKVLTYFYGALLGAILLGAFTRRGSNASLVAGMFLSVVSVLLLQTRNFLQDLSLAPNVVRHALEQLPGGAAEALTAYVPLVAWPYWIVVGTLVTLGVGMLGSRGVVAR